MNWNAILNLNDYTPVEHALFAIGCFGWVIAYAFIIRNIFKNKFVEIPFIAICANFAWEVLWSFTFQTNMGELYVWGYRIWFFMDVVIVYGFFKYGWKQLRDDILIKNFKPLLIFSMACWFVMLYFYIGKWDEPVTHMGANSGYILNAMMSLLYPLLLIRMGTTKGFSMLAAWCKGLGTFLISIFCYLHFDMPWLLSLCAISAILDAWYIGIFISMRKRERLETELQPA